MNKRSNTIKSTNLIKNLSSNLKSKIFGQDEAIDTIVDYITINIAGLSDKEKPIGSFLFTGPTGVGKTELSKQLAKELHIYFQRFDMSEYSTERSADNLIGGAAGLVGYEEGGLLTNAILENPNCVLLFDEIEKADKTVLNKFLQIMDYGKLTSSKGEEVYFNNTIVIFTSNLGSIKNEIRTAGFTSESYIQTQNSFDEYLSAEFIGRINQSIEFNPIGKDISKMIVKKCFKNIEKLLKNRFITLSASDTLIEKIVEESNEKLGARSLENIIIQNIKLIISQDLISGQLTNFSSIEFDWDQKDKLFKHTIKKNENLYNFSGDNKNFFVNVIDAQNYAKENPGVIITRSLNGNGFIIKE